MRAPRTPGSTAARHATPHGNDTTVMADDNVVGEAALLRFANLFGNGAGQVPQGSTIHNAILSIYVTDADPNDLVAMHRMLAPWTEASTFASLVGGVQADGSEAAAPALLSFSSGTTGWLNLGGAAFTAAVQAWAQGAANEGVAFISNAADRWTFASSEHPTVSLRPYLTLDFTPPQAPVVTTSGGSASYTENAAAVPVDPTLTLTDADSTQITGATVQLSAGYVPGQDSLGMSSQPGISWSWNGSTGTLTLTGSASVAAYQAALRTVTYFNGSEAPTTAPRTVSFSVTDGLTTSVAATRQLQVVSVNDAPTTSNASATAAEDAAAVPITLTGSDVDGTVTHFQLGSLPAQGALYLDAGLTTLAQVGVDHAATAQSLTLYYVPAADWHGSTTFQFAARDNTGSYDATPATGTLTIQPVNDAPTGLPTIGGTPTEDQTLTAVTAGIADADGLGAFSFQWLRGGVAIAGATTSTYVLGDADIGTSVSVRVNYTDGQGTAESLTSAAVGPVANFNDAPTGLPAISGTPTEDQTLTAVTAAIADIDGLGAFSFQWLRGGVAIAGATASTYTLGDADVGGSISVRVSYIDGQGTAESLTSAAVGPVANVNDAPTGLPTISGTPTEDQTLSAVTAGIADIDGLGAFSYQWLRGGVAIAGATNSTYTLGDADVGTSISVRVNYIDGQGTAESLTSAARSPTSMAPTGGQRQRRSRP